MPEVLALIFCLQRRAATLRSQQPLWRVDAQHNAQSQERQCNAFHDESIELQYQPIPGGRDDRLCAVETLLCRRAPDGGFPRSSSLYSPTSDRSLR